MMSEEAMAMAPEQAASSETITAETSAAAQGAASAGTTSTTPRPGMTVKGKVRNIVAFGAFVDIGAGRDGLAHISVLQRAGIDKTLKVGDEIEVQVRNVDPATNRISLALPTTERAPKTPLSALAIGAIVTGRVVRLARFGAFVDIGAEADALLHVSQLGRGYTARPSDVLKAGDEVHVRILDVDMARRRISLTMKGVDGEAGAEPEPAPVAAPSSAAEEEPTAGVFAAAWEKAQSQRRARRRRPGA